MYAFLNISLLILGAGVLVTGTFIVDTFKLSDAGNDNSTTFCGKKFNILEAFFFSIFSHTMLFNS